MKIEVPYHDGELEVQRRVGVLDVGKRNGRVISDTILPGALQFIEQQRFVVLGFADSGGALWTTALIGEVGFIRAPSDSIIELNLSKLDSGVALTLSSFSLGSPLGLLVIELASRRRLRVNGRVEKNDSGVLRLRVLESYPNCPKYIQSRHLVVEKTKAIDIETMEGTVLREEDHRLIQSSDTFFVSSQHPERGVDASHRGGKKGFVKVVDQQTLRIPDYPGNNMFNTLGNFLVNPRAGLTFVDFDSSRFLQLTGEVDIIWEAPGSAAETGGTLRFWDFRVSRWLRSGFSFRTTWEHLSDSPFNI